MRVYEDNRSAAMPPAARRTGVARRLFEQAKAKERNQPHLANGEKNLLANYPYNFPFCRAGS